MMRAIVLAIGLLCCAGGVLGVTLGGAEAGIGFLVFGLLILAGTLFERHYHRNLTALPGPGWERMEERFKDPSTGEILDVWYNPQSGERRYVTRQ